MGNIDRRLNNLENSTGIDDTPAEYTEQDRLIDFALRLYWNCFYYIANRFPETERRLLIDYQNSCYYSHLEPVTIPPDTWNKFMDIAWNCCSFLKAASFLVSAGYLDGDETDANEFEQQANALEDTDMPDLSRTYWPYIPFPGAPDICLVEPMEWYQANGWGTYGPRQDVTKPKGIISSETTYRMNVITWCKLYGSNVVNRFIRLDKIHRLDIIRRNMETQHNEVKKCKNVQH